MEAFLTVVRRAFAFSFVYVLHTFLTPRSTSGARLLTMKFISFCKRFETNYGKWIRHLFSKLLMRKNSILRSNLSLDKARSHQIKIATDWLQTGFQLASDSKIGVNGTMLTQSEASRVQI